LESDKRFTGSIAKLYESHLVPLIFEPYAADLAQRVGSRRPRRLLEIAAGTGVVTRRLAATLDATVPIVATDLNPAMLEEARARGTARPVEWREADAMQLPFADASFDTVACQFGCMFFPDKPRAFAEVKRVLRRGGVFLFNAWDRIEENEFADVVTREMAAMFPDDPPRFLPRTPHGYHDAAAIARDLREGGFASAPVVTTIAARSRAATAEVPAVGYCQGTPLRGEIESRAPARLEEATRRAAAAIAARFGEDEVDGKIQAHVVSVEA
jgi:SAM-dependent methyltransferase